MRCSKAGNELLLRCSPGVEPAPHSPALLRAMAADGRVDELIAHQHAMFSVSRTGVPMIVLIKLTNNCSAVRIPADVEAVENRRKILYMLALLERQRHAH